jgi:hypothetical protein
MAKKPTTEYARYTFAFAADLQKLADDKHVRIVSFNTKPTHDHGRKSCDLLSVRFLVNRPDRDETEKPAQTIEGVVEELEHELEEPEEPSAESLDEISADARKE